MCSGQLPPQQAVVGDSPQRVLHLGLSPEVGGHRVPGGGGVAGGGGALFLLPVVTLLILRGEGGRGAVTSAWGGEKFNKMWSYGPKNEVNICYFPINKK